MVRFCSRYYQAPLGQVVAMALPPVLRRAGQPPDLREPDPLLTLTAEGAAVLETPGRETIARRLLRALFERGPQLKSRLRDEAASAGSTLNALIQKGLIAPAPPAATPRALPGPALKAAQQAAVDTIAQGFGRFGAYLLHGVTGSGKTEVYLQLIDRVLAQGRQALMLVPEIALTPQLEQRVADRFPGAQIVSLHSAQNDGKRSRGFLQALCGQAHIVLGTRLSVFTPLPRLGLIVVDEEHDPSFKQQDGVRYSARDLAVWRAHERGVPVVLGSATPSLESWHHAECGRYQRISLPDRAAAAQMPTTRIVDTRRLKLDNGMSPALFAAIEARLARGEQSLVFLNRRGYAPVLACAACGWVSQCHACSANRVLHLADRLLRCHHCGASSGVPPACPVCGNQDIQGFGRGTQRLEAFLEARYPEARVLRIDRDSARTPAQWAAMLAAIHEGRADILVGTQMLAKGHDFPRLTLVGVLNSDASLHASDCRAPERLFAQLMQVGGRSGRGELPGEVLLQTEYPDHPLYQALVDHDYPRFAKLQLEERRAAGFPPFTHQAVLRAEAPTMAESLEFLQRASTQVAPPESVQHYDAVPMRLSRRAGLERAQLLVESPSRAALQAHLAHWLPRLYEMKTARGLHWHIETDPIEL
jgi:primosomal protein N' (replication factor Y)